MEIKKMYEVVSIKQVVREVDELYTLRSPNDVAKIAHHYIGDEDREVALVICLNVKNQVIAVHKAHIGSLSMSIMHPREIFKVAILNNASSIMLSHNHPSGSTIISQEDIAVTKRVVHAGQILGIDVLDHIIVTPNVNVFTSLQSKGHI